jgi:hypothetical protein
MHKKELLWLLFCLSKKVTKKRPHAPNRMLPQVTYAISSIREAHAVRTRVDGQHATKQKRFIFN